MTITQFDSVTVSAIPADAPAVAGYVGGDFHNYPVLVARWPKARHLSIAINATERARCLDVENGDAVPAQAPGWLRDFAIKTEGLPVIYAQASNVAAVIDACASAGISRGEYLIWSAHIGHGEHICSPAVCGFPQADGTQWTFTALGRNLDQSLLSDRFFPIPDPHHYLWFDTTVRDVGRGRHGSERQIVEEYDSERAHWKLWPRRLRRLRDDMGILAGRLETVMDQDGDPTGAKFHRSWRHDGLTGRAMGQRRV